MSEQSDARTERHAQTNAERRSARVAREDLVLFLNACFAHTGQDEFYGSAAEQALSVDFLHAYTLGNYRRLYARTLAAGINHASSATIVERLLASGRETPPDFRAEEGELIRATLRLLPPQRVLRLFGRLRRARVNNRRTRAVVRDWLASRADPGFDAVKYRRKIRDAVAHTHGRADGERGRFLFGDKSGEGFATPLFESYRQAQYRKSAVYELPFTVAEGFAAKHGIPRAEFLRKIEGRMTTAERLRVQAAAARAKGVKIQVDLARAPLTKLVLAALAIPHAERCERLDELRRAVDASAERAARRAGLAAGEASLGHGKVACVLDRSYSASGSSEKRRRPLGVAIAAEALLRVAARESRAFWTGGESAESVCDPLLVEARGQTNLAEPLLDALEWGADLIVLVSDGFENDPPRAVETIARAVRSAPPPHYGARAPVLVHVNPVFDSAQFAPRSLGPSLPTLGVRDAEDIPTVLAFARFVDGSASLAELEAYLHKRCELWLQRAASHGSKQTGAEG